MSLWSETLEGDPFCREVHELREKLALKLSGVPEHYAIVPGLKAAIDGLDQYTGYSSTSDYVPARPKEKI